MYECVVILLGWAELSKAIALITVVLGMLIGAEYSVDCNVGFDPSVVKYILATSETEDSVRT